MASRSILKWLRLRYSRPRPRHITASGRPDLIAHNRFMRVLLNGRRRWQSQHTLGKCTVERVRSIFEQRLLKCLDMSALTGRAALAAIAAARACVRVARHCGRGRWRRWREEGVGYENVTPNPVVKRVPCCCGPIRLWRRLGIEQSGKWQRGSKVQRQFGQRRSRRCGGRGS